MVASEERRESDWSTQDYEEIQALYIHEASLCNSCGQPLDVCRDPKAAVMVEDEICRFTAAVDVAKRTLDAQHKNEKPQHGKPMWSDGMVIWPRPMTDAEFEKYSGASRA